MADTYDSLTIICFRLLLAWFFACIGCLLGMIFLTRNNFGHAPIIHPLFPLYVTIMGLAPGSYPAVITILSLVAVSVYVGYVSWPWWSCMLVITAYAVQAPVAMRAWCS